MKRWFVDHPNIGGVTLVITIGHREVRVSSGCEKAVQLMIVSKRVAQPDSVAVLPDHPAGNRIGNRAQECFAARFFRVGCVMDIADDGEAYG